MNFKTTVQSIALLLLFTLLAGCQSPVPPATPDRLDATPASPAAQPSPDTAASFLTQYEFPTSIDPGKRYLFYLHGRIIEDQGLPAVSPDFGEYQYEAILQALESRGFEVISEQRAKDTDAEQYAQRVVEQIRLLLDAKVLPENISVVGASKGAGIAAVVSSLMENTNLNFVLLGFCAPGTAEEWIRDQTPLYGNVLAIRDASDELAGSCNELLAYSTGKGLGKHKEIVLQVGTGHGILYQPLDEWIVPAVEWSLGQTLSAEESAILDSLEQVDDYPLYTMHYSGPYTLSLFPYEIPGQPTMAVTTPPLACERRWGCSLFASLGDEEDRLFGRNFDWRFSPALLLFNDPPDGYASVSMVDIAYLGFAGERSRHLTDLPLEELRPLLDATYMPFDGMNEKGLAIGMAAVPGQQMPDDPNLKTIGQLELIREILDHAGTVEEAIEILNTYNIDMGSVPIHYQIANVSGDSVVVEFYKGEMVLLHNESPWQTATNFLIASTNGNTQGQCWRYDLISRHLENTQGRISAQDAIHLLEQVSQNNTQWSVVYQMTNGDINVVMGRGYSGGAHTFHLDQSIP